MAVPKRSKRPAYADVADKEPTWRHTVLADWLNENTGYEVDVKTVQLAQSLANEFRASDEYAAAIAERENAREAEKAEKAAQRVARARAKAEKLRAQLEAIESGLPAEDAPKAKKSAKKAAAKAVPANVTEIRPKPAKKATPPPPPPPVVEDDDEDEDDEPFQDTVDDDDDDDLF